MKLMTSMLVAGAAILMSSAVLAQAYPNKPVRIVVPFTPGSSTDITARMVGERLTAVLGQPFVVENRPGAGGRLGAEIVAKAAPDGHTLLVHSSAHTATPALYKDIPYNTEADFAGVTPLVNLPNVMVTAPDSRLKSVKAVIDYAKANPGKLTIASAGAGSGAHMNAEKFSARAGITHTHVPYRGTPEALTDIMAGRVDIFFAPLNSAMAYVKDNRVFAVAVGTAQRADALPNVPTTIEGGVPNSDYNFWLGLLAPSKTPRAVVDRLNTETVKILQSSDMLERLRQLGATPMPMKPAEFDAYIKAELVSIAEVVKTANIKIE
jgi:tripartite-type tricarboxylate transporter receptor subunit TctC